MVEGTQQQSGHTLHPLFHAFCDHRRPSSCAHATSALHAPLHWTPAQRRMRCALSLYSFHFNSWFTFVHPRQTCQTLPCSFKRGCDLPLPVPSCDCPVCATLSQCHARTLHDATVQVNAQLAVRNVHCSFSCAHRIRCRAACCSAERCCFLFFSCWWRSQHANL